MKPNGQDPRWQLVQRVAASTGFQRSQRLRDFLLFACERVLSHPGTLIREPEVRVEVFGRSAEMDTAGDTLVRVQASHLRKRLVHYFSSEGAGEPLIIELPRGTYTPVFRERRAAPRAETAMVGPGPRRRLRSAAGILLAAVVAASGWLFWSGRGVDRGFAERPAVHRLWHQMFGAEPLYLVLSDSNLTLFQDLLHHQLSLVEYQRQTFPSQTLERIKDEPSRMVADRLMNRDFTSIADATLVQRVASLAALEGRAVDVVLARRADPEHVRSRNVILSGSRRANPWLELFEGRLNFQSRFDEGQRRCYFQNVAPLPGEAQIYAVSWNEVGYCRIAYLPNLGGAGRVLILSGTDLNSTDAAAEFVTSERWVRHLRSKLGADKGPLPYFEILLKTRLLLGTAASFEMIAHRLVPAG